MANKRVTDLTEAASISSADVLHIVQGGTDKQAPASLLVTAEDYNADIGTEDISGIGDGSVKGAIKNMASRHIRYFTMIGETTVGTSTSTISTYDGRNFDDYEGILTFMFKPGSSSYWRVLGSIHSAMLMYAVKIELNYEDSGAINTLYVTYTSGTSLSVKSSVEGTLDVESCMWSE